MAAQPPPHAAPQPVRRGRDRDRRHRHPRLPRLHEGHPVHAALRGQGGVHVLERAAPELARPDRRRRRRQGQADRRPGGDRQHRRDDGDRRSGAAAAQGRDGQDPAADLPRGQLLRRPAAGLAGQRGPRRRLDDRGHPDGDAGPARPGADLAAVRHAAGPARRARGAGHRPALEADRGRRPRRRPVGARGDGGEVVERRVRVRRPGRARPGRGQPGAPRHGARPRPRAADRRRRAHLGGARPQRVRARGPDRQLQPHDGRVRLRGGEPERLDQRAGADARDRQRRVRVAQRSRSRPRARGRWRSCPACARRRRRSTPPSPGSSR